MTQGSKRVGWQGQVSELMRKHGVDRPTAIRIYKGEVPAIPAPGQGAVLGTSTASTPEQSSLIPTIKAAEGLISTAGGLDKARAALDLIEKYQGSE